MHFQKLAQIEFGYINIVDKNILKNIFFLETIYWLKETLLIPKWEINKIICSIFIDFSRSRLRKVVGN
jgi:hypothetical protein